MRNSESAYLFTYSNIWKLASIFIISAVSILLSLLYKPDKYTCIQQSSFINNKLFGLLRFATDRCYALQVSGRYAASLLPKSFII